MTKTLNASVLGFAFLAAGSAFAMPSVGDLAVYKGIQITNNGTTAIPFTLQSTLTAHDATKKQFTQVDTTTVDGKEQTQTSAVDETQIMTTAAMEDLVAHCADNGGTAERVKVKAGSFDTCKFNQDNGGTANIGVVPFGLVKAHLVDVDAQTKATTTTDAELDSYKVGQ
jgi:hypothetical protein